MHLRHLPLSPLHPNFFVIAFPSLSSHFSFDDIVVMNTGCPLKSPVKTLKNTIEPGSIPELLMKNLWVWVWGTDVLSTGGSKVRLENHMMVLYYNFHLFCRLRFYQPNLSFLFSFSLCLFVDF